MEISVIFPAYKEAENLKRILPNLKKAMSGSGVDCDVFVIDTVEPTDDTREVCESNGVNYVRRKGGNLYGDAIRTGIEVADGKYTVVMDADGSHNPDDIIRLYNCLKERSCDVVIGSRYCKGGKTHNGFVSRTMSKTLNYTYRIVFGLKVKDVSDSFRIYDSVKLKSLTLTCDNFDIVEEILIRLNNSFSDLKIDEVPIFFNKREFGESKRDLVKFIFSYLNTIGRLYSIRKQ